MKVLLFFVALVTIFIVGSGHGHPDCNRKRVVEQFLYMCTAYSTYSSGIKRETYAFGASAPPWPQNFPLGPKANEPVTPLQTYYATVAWQQQPENFQVKYPLNGKGEGIGLPHHPHYQQQQQGGPIAGRMGQAAGQVSQGQLGQLPAKRGKSSLHGNGIDMPNEPQDFQAFNEYLNPIYADAEWQSSIERWRRDPQVNKEIYRFVKDKCCVSGCPFPDEYYELDRRVNICGMR